MEIKEIVTEWLKANGYDGLYDEDECGCLIEDFAPCGDCFCKCTPGVLMPCDCDGNHDFHIGPKEAQ